MDIFNLWYTYLIAYLFLTVIRTQSFKVLTKTSKSDSAIVILLQFFAGIMTLIWLPFFEIQFPTDLRVYLFLGLAIIFFAIVNRLNIIVIKDLEASTFSILKQTHNVFMIIAGLLLFREPFVVTRIMGALLIIFSNFLIFYKRGESKVNKHVWLGIIAMLFLTVAVSIDIGISGEFNLPFYIAITFVGPAILTFIIERPKASDIYAEFKNSNKLLIIATTLSWSMVALALLRAYVLGDITVVAPLAALNVILNVLAGYIFLKEKTNLLKKVIASILILFGVILIQM